MLPYAADANFLFCEYSWRGSQSNFPNARLYEAFDPSRETISGAFYCPQCQHDYEQWSEGREFDRNSIERKPRREHYFGPRVPVSFGATDLLKHPSWIIDLQRCEDDKLKREILVRCGEVMLPYWEARFDTDEKMSELVSLMRQSLTDNSIQARQRLNEGIPQKPGYLSPIPGLPETPGNDCPADFAGESILKAASAIRDDRIHDDFLSDAIDAAVEAIGRVMAERTPADEEVDFLGQAAEHLGRRIRGDYTS